MIYYDSYEDDVRFNISASTYDILNDEEMAILGVITQCSYCGAKADFSDSHECGCSKSKKEDLNSYRLIQKDYFVIYKYLRKKALNRIHNSNYKDKRRKLLAESKPQITPAIEADFYEAQEGKCYYCTAELFEKYHVDHKKPVANGGLNDLTNLVLACPDCNKRKWSLSVSTFFKRLRAKMSEEEIKDHKSKIQKINHELKMIIKNSDRPHIC